MAEYADRKHNITRNVDRKPQMVGHAESELFYELDQENELRILVGENNVKIELLNGQAEVYGTEMELNKVYFLSPNSYIAIFTWQGCVIKVIGTPEDCYFVDESSMILNVIIHASLEERRIQAEALNKTGPVVLVVGQNDVSKISLCRLLLNYAVLLGRQPLFIDLDVGQSSISFPGTMGILPVEKPADIVTGFDNHPVQVYQYGYRSAWQSIVSYFLLMQRLSMIIQSDFIQKNQNIKTSGVIINGCDWSKCEVRNHGYDTVFLATKCFEIDVLCVLHEVQLYLQLKRDMPPSMKIIFIPKMYGDIERRWEAKSKCRLSRIRQHFFGLNNQMRNFSFEVKYSDIKVFKVHAKSVKRHTEFSGEVKPNDAKLVFVKLTRKLIDQILSLSSADNVQEEIMYMHVIGFICIVDVDIVRDTITVLSPQPGPLPTKILFMGDTRIRKHESDSKIKKCESDTKIKKC